MMNFSQGIIDGLNLAFNEAIVLGLDMDQGPNTVYLTLHPIALQQDETIPMDNRFLIPFRNVGRIAASMTLEPGTKAVKFEPEELPDRMNDFKNESLYGWEFIDIDEAIVFKQWKENVSFDKINFDAYSNQHTIDICQEDRYSNKVIDLRIWFETIEIFDSNLNIFDIKTFIDNGNRGWDKLYKDGWTTPYVGLKGKLILKE